MYNVKGFVKGIVVWLHRFLAFFYSLVLRSVTSECLPALVSVLCLVSVACLLGWKNSTNFSLWDTRTKQSEEQWASVQVHQKWNMSHKSFPASPVLFNIFFLPIQAWWRPNVCCVKPRCTVCDAVFDFEGEKKKKKTKAIKSFVGMKYGCHLLCHRKAVQIWEDWVQWTGQCTEIIRVIIHVLMNLHFQRCDFKWMLMLFCACWVC